MILTRACPRHGPLLSPKDMVENREGTEVLTSPPLIFSLQCGVTVSSSVSTGAEKIRLAREGV